MNAKHKDDNCFAIAMADADARGKLIAKLEKSRKLTGWCGIFIFACFVLDGLGRILDRDQHERPWMIAIGALFFYVSWVHADLKIKMLKSIAPES